MNNCNTATVITYSDSRTGGACDGVITRTWTATDACGSASTTSTVAILDRTVPTLSTPVALVG